MGEPDIQKYCGLMEEVKRRTNVIDFFLGGGHALYKPTTVESIALQFRKVLELVAFGSLIANKDVYAAAYAKFAEHWNARLLLRDLERVNAHFYPKPVIEVPSSSPKIAHGLENRQPDYLSKKEFVKVYEKCGGILHADNPYGSQVDYNYYHSKFPVWRTRIINLLNNHQIQLVSEPGFYLIHMKENREDKVHYYRFEPTPSP